MNGLAADLKHDEKDRTPETFVLIQGLQNYKKLRQEMSSAFPAATPEVLSTRHRADEPYQRRLQPRFHVIATATPTTT